MVNKATPKLFKSQKVNNCQYLYKNVLFSKIVFKNEPDTDRPPADDFDDFRSRCGDIVQDVSNLLSGPQCFTIMFNMLKEESQTDITWDRTEAILWIMAWIAPQVGKECPAVQG